MAGGREELLLLLLCYCFSLDQGCSTGSLATGSHLATVPPVILAVTATKVSSFPLSLSVTSSCPYSWGSMMWWEGSSKRSMIAMLLTQPGVGGSQAVHVAERGAGLHALHMQQVEGLHSAGTPGALPLQCAAHTLCHLDTAYSLLPSRSWMDLV